MIRLQKLINVSSVFVCTHGSLFSQVIFSVFRLDFLMRVFSRHLQRGFVFGAVLFLLPSQIKVLAGLIGPNFSGTFGFFKVLLLVFSPQHHLSSISTFSCLTRCLYYRFTLIFRHKYETAAFQSFAVSVCGMGHLDSRMPECLFPKYVSEKKWRAKTSHPYSKRVQWKCCPFRGAL